MPENRIVSRRLTKPVDEAASLVTAQLVQLGVPLVARIDHAGAAREAGLTMLPTIVLVFGNPRLGTPLMRDCPTLAIDLPLRLLFWEDTERGPRVGYLDPFVLAYRHGVGPVHDPALHKMCDLLEQLSTLAAQS